MPKVYDDQETRTTPGDTARQDQERMGAGRTAAQDAEVDKLNTQFYSPSAGDDGGGKKPPGGLSKLKSFGKKHGKKLWLSGAVLGGGFVMFMLVLFLLGSLMLPHFFQNVVAYRFANAARTYRHANNAAISKKIILDSADDIKESSLRARYGQLKSWALLEKYRPAAIARNMEATGKLDFEYTPRKNPLARARMTAIFVNGERIPLEQQTKWGVPFSRANNNIRLAQSIDDALFKTMRGTQVTAQVLRTSVGSKILERIGYKGFYAWANKAKDYKGLASKDADRKLLQESHKNAVGPGVRGSPSTPATQRSVDETNKKMAEVMKDPAELDKMVASGEVSEKVILTMNESLKDTKLEQITRGLSTFNAVAIPMCLIIDGSVESSAPTIDAKSEASQRMFLKVGGMAHQQQAGEVAGEAIGAANRQFNHDGGMARANLSGRASGAPGNTSDTLSPYAGSLGDFSLANVIFGPVFGNGFASKINDGLLPTCKVVASVEYAVVSGAAELVITFFTGGGSAAATRAGTTVLSRVITEYLKGFGRQILSKQGVKRLVVQGGAIAGATLIARMLVSSYSSQYYNGISRGAQAVDEVDAGGEANANEVSRAMGGRPLTSAESIVTRAKSREQNAISNGSASLYERYVALANPNSLLAKMGYAVMANANRSLIANSLTSMSKVFNPLAMAGLFSNISPKVSAADALDESSYTRTVFGFSEEEVELMETKETYYDVLENELVLENSGKKAAIEEKYGKCGPDGESIGTLFAKGYIVREENGTPDPKQGDCSPENMGVNNKQGFGDLVYRWRLTKLYESGLTIGNEVGAPTPSTRPAGAAT